MFHAPINHVTMSFIKRMVTEMNAWIANPIHDDHEPSANMKIYYNSDNEMFFTRSTVVDILDEYQQFVFAKIENLVNDTEERLVERFFLIFFQKYSIIFFIIAAVDDAEAVAK